MNTMQLVVFLHLTFLSYLCDGRPQLEKEARILRQVQVSDENGYKFAYVTSNGISQSEVGEVKNAGTDEEYVAKKGIYSYIDPDNVEHVVRYTADKNGFQSNATTNQLTPELMKQRLSNTEELPDRIGTNLLITLSG